eukprot:4056471-Prymnesium_polylepis.1
MHDEPGAAAARVAVGRWQRRDVAGCADRHLCGRQGRAGARGGAGAGAGGAGAGAGGWPRGEERAAVAERFEVEQLRLELHASRLREAAALQVAHAAASALQLAQTAAHGGRRSADFLASTLVSGAASARAGVPVDGAVEGAVAAALDACVDAAGVSLPPSTPSTPAGDEYGTAALLPGSDVAGSEVARLRAALREARDECVALSAQARAA